MSAPQSRDRLADLAAIHIKAKELGLDEDAYRALLKRVTGLDSSADMTDAQRLEVLRAMNGRSKPMRIERLTAKNFQGLQAVDLELGSMTVLYGLNGSGKSSVVEAILYALTGEAPRHERLPDAIRQGSKALEVELTLTGGRSIMRTRNHREAMQCVDGEVLQAPKMRGAIEQLVGTRIESLACALRSSALLDLKPSERQALLLDLVGARFEPATIVSELGTAIEGLRTLGLPTPLSLGELAATHDRAVQARRDAKRQRDEREGDLGRLPSVAADLADAAAVESLESLRVRVQELRGRRDAAIRSQASASGASEERRRQLTERAEVLRRVPEAIEPTERLRTAAETAVGHAVGDMVRAEAQRDELREQIEGLAGVSESMPADADRVEEDLARAEAELALLATRRDEAADEGKRIKADLDKLTVKAGDTCRCSTCGQHVPESLFASIRGTVESLRTTWQERARKYDETAASVALLRKRAQGIVALRQRQGLQAELATVEQQIADARQRRDTAMANARTLQDQAERARKYADARRELADLERQLAAPPASAPAADVEQLTRDVQRAEAVLAAGEQLQRRLRLAGEVKQAEQRIAAADLVAEACAPTGIRARLLTRALAPFLSAANAALARLCNGYAIDVTTEDGLGIVVRRGDVTLTPDQLSDGERMRVLFVIQVAVARLAHAPLLAFDRIELLDEEGRKLLRALGSECVSAGIQVVLLSCAAPPAACPPGYRMYALASGTAKPVPQRVAA